MYVANDNYIFFYKGKYDQLKTVKINELLVKK